MLRHSRMRFVRVVDRGTAGRAPHVSSLPSVTLQPGETRTVPCTAQALLRSQ